LPFKLEELRDTISSKTSLQIFHGTKAAIYLDKISLVPNLDVINAPKSTTGANALSVFPFLVIDDNQLRLI
jgi:hypothetical protein